MKETGIDWEQRLWQLSSQLYRDAIRDLSDVSLKDLAKASWMQAVNMVNIYQEQEKDKLNFHSEII